MTVKTHKDENSKREYDVLLSLSTALKDFQEAVEPRNLGDIYSVLSEALAAHGFQVIGVKFDKKKKMKVITVHLLSESQELSTLEGKENIPFMADTVSLVDFKQFLSRLLGDSPALFQYTPPDYGVTLPVNDVTIVVASDALTKDVLPAFSVFADLVKSFILFANQLAQTKEQKEFSERIIRGVQDGILMEDAEGMITFVNPRLLEMVGYTEKELIGRHYTIIAHPESLSLVKAETKKRVRGIKSQYEAYMQHKDGTPVPVIVSGTPVIENGEYSGNLTVFTDRSAQKKAEDEVRALKEFNEKIVQSLHEALMIEDTRGVITFVNPKVEALLEREKDEIIGHHWQEVAAPECIAKIEEESAKRKHGISGQYEAVLLTKQNRRIPVMVGATPLFEGDEFTGVISVCVDLTMVKEKEKEIRQKNEDLRLLSKINKALNKGEDLKTILDMVIQEVQHIFNLSAAAIMFLTADKKCILSDTFTVSSSVQPIVRDLSFTIGKGSVLEKVINQKEGYLITDEEIGDVLRKTFTPEIAAEIQKKIQMKSAIFLPLIVENEVIGIMSMGSSKELDQNDLNRSKSLSKYLALAVDHAQLDEVVQKASEELQTHLLEQTYLRELVESLYMVKTQKEVMDRVAEGLDNLGYTYYGIVVKDLEEKYVNIVKMQPKSVMDTVGKIMKKGRPPLERILLPKKYFFKGTRRRIALVTDNIVLKKEKNVISLPLKEFFQLWVGQNEHLQEAIIEAVGVHSLICIPVQVEETFLGAFVVGSSSILTHHDFVVLETLGHIVGEALGKLQYSKTLEKKSQDLEFSNKQLQLLQEMSNALNSTMDLEELLRILVRGIRSVFGYSTPSVYLLSDDREYLIVKEADINSKLLDSITKLVGFGLEQYKIPLFEGSLLKKVIDTGEPLITDDIPRFLKDYTEKERLRRLAGALYRLEKVDWVAALPLMAADEAVGMLVFGSKRKIEPEDLDALSGFLDQAVLAVDKARIYEQLAEANQMKSEFIDIASHELRTPLTSIKLYLEMIQKDRYGPLSPELKEKIGLLQANAERLQDIIEKTLVSSRIQKKGLELKKEEVSLKEIAQIVRTELHPVWGPRKQQIEVRGPYKLPLVKGDRDALWKVITALLENAIKYSPEGAKITVKVYDREHHVEVAVMDEGIGIKQEHQEKIFEAFYIIPSEADLARMDGRTGLGLFIAKGIVEEHDGEIWVESVYGLGSTFHFTIPK